MLRMVRRCEVMGPGPRALGLGLVRISGAGSLKVIKLRRHSRVPAGQLLDRYLLGFVICKAEVAVCSDERFFRLLEVVDRLVDFFDRLLEDLPGCKVIVPAESTLECLKFIRSSLMSRFWSLHKFKEFGLVLQ